jgi:hypothetical protein
MKFLRFFLVTALPLIVCLSIASPALAAGYLPFTTTLEIVGDQSSQVIGSVEISREGFITFQIDETVTPCLLEKTELYIGDKPPNKTKPERYNFQHDGLGGVTTDWYDNIDLASFDVNGDGILYIAACAEVTKGTAAFSKSGKKSSAPESAWAKGDQSSGKGKNYTSFFSLYWWNLG